MRPLGMPPTPMASSSSRLPVGIAETGGALSRVAATPAPRRRSTSASAAARSWVAAGGGASRTVAVGMIGGLLCGRRGLDRLAANGYGVGRDGGPVALALSLGSANLSVAVPTRTSGHHPLPAGAGAATGAVPWWGFGQAG